LWVLPRCAADLAPPPRFVALANATTILAAYGSQSFAIIGERSACRLLGEALGNPNEQVTSAWAKLGELSDDARKALVSELWHGHLRALVPDADRKAALNFVFTLFGKRGVALLAGVARTLHGLSADECHAWDVHGEVGDDRLNETWFVKRALEFAGRYMVKTALLKDYYARERGGSESNCVARGGDCLVAYCLEPGRDERWLRLLPCGHWVCGNCEADFFKNYTKCSACRQTVMETMGYSG
jgi:hypothetical protein